MQYRELPRSPRCALIMRPLRIAIVAGETSGDRLGADLIGAIRELEPSVAVQGMAGPRMIAAGCDDIASIDQLAVMGLVEVARHYPQLWRLRRRLIAHFLAERPDVFVGIDVPDFTLGIEQRLKSRGIRTVHLVCPQVWAWRPRRARKIARATDLLLAMFPFEPEFFRQHGVATEFIGHPLADAMPLEPERGAARERLGVDDALTLIAILPGSRRQELKAMLTVFLQAAELMAAGRDNLEFVVCVAGDAQREEVGQRLGEFARLGRCRLISGDAQLALTAADVAMVASGTVTMEGLFAKTPMVVGYRMAPLSYQIIKRMVKIPFVAMPNILFGARLLPELIQDQLTPQNLCESVFRWLDDAPGRAEYARVSTELHEDLRRGAAQQAAAAVLEIARKAGTG